MNTTVEETKDTSTPAVPAAGPAAPTPAATTTGTEESSETPAESPKIDFNQLLDDDDYAEKVLATETPAPSPVAAPEPKDGAKSDQAPKPPASEPTGGIEIKYEGETEVVPIDRAAARLQEAKHLKTIYERDLAPIAKILRSNPVLAQAMQEAARGNEASLKRAIGALTRAPDPDEETPETPPVDQKLLAALKADPRFKGYKEEDLLAIVALQDVRDRVSREKAQEVPPEAKALELRARSYIAALRTSEGETYKQVQPYMGRLLNMAKEKLSPEEYQRMVVHLSDPAFQDAEGMPLFHSFYADAKRLWQAEKDKAAAAGGTDSAPADPAAPPAAPPARPAGISATLEPGSGVVQTRRAASPNYANMSAAERAAYFHRLADGDE